METKVCNHCKANLPWSAFRLKKNGRPDSYCITCKKELSATRWMKPDAFAGIVAKHLGRVLDALKGCPSTSAVVCEKLGISASTFTQAIRPAIESGEIIRTRKVNTFTYWLASERRREVGPPAKESKQDDDEASDVMRREQIAAKASQETAWIADLVKGGQRFSPFGVLISAKAKRAPNPII